MRLEAGGYSVRHNSNPRPGTATSARRIREVPFSDAELGGLVDSAHAVVLPYKNILISGAAMFALSRNRPVLAPNIGSLPELRNTVGDEWIYLYDGDFSDSVLVAFREWMLTSRRAGVAPLDAYEFRRVGQDVRDFIKSVVS